MKLPYQRPMVANLSSKPRSPWILKPTPIAYFYEFLCRPGLCAGGDHTQAVGAGGQSLPNATDSERHAFRENAHFMRPSGHRCGSQFRRKRQPTDSLRLLTGQQCETICIVFCCFKLFVVPEYGFCKRETALSSRSIYF